MKLKFTILFFVLAFATNCLLAASNTVVSDTTETHAAHTSGATTSESHSATSDGHAHATDAAHGHDAHEEFNPGATAIHHISDANVYTILDAISIPLPMILFAPDKGWEFFSSGKFHAGHHEDGYKAYNGYVLHHGSVHRVTDASFPQGEVDGISFTHKTEKNAKGKDIDINYAQLDGKEYRLDARSTLDGGILGGGITSFYDFSLTKNVVSMLLVALFLLWVFRRVAKMYRTSPDKAPSGLQGFVEPMFTFIRDEVAIPFIGKDKYMKYFPLLASIFFFILGLNLFGQVPFFGGTNVTGNLTVTMVLALIIFVIVNINGNKDYWKHIFWMPDVPAFVKVILTPVEVMGLFIKPLTLMLRLAGNISAGHIAILSFIGLIFIFGKSGASLGGSAIGTAMAVPLTLFMMAIELIVAFVQAFVFTLLAASYIGAAIEEHHHGDHAADHH